MRGGALIRLIRASSSSRSSGRVRRAGCRSAAFGASTARCRRRTRRRLAGRRRCRDRGSTCSGTVVVPGRSGVGTARDGDRLVARRRRRSRSMHEAQQRPLADVLGEQARDVAQEQRHVVARRLRGGQEGSGETQAVGGQRQRGPAPAATAGSGAVAPERLGQARRALVQCAVARQVPAPRGEGVGEDRGALRQRRGPGPQVAEQRRGVGQRTARSPGRRRSGAWKAGGVCEIQSLQVRARRPRRARGRSCRGCVYRSAWVLATGATRRSSELEPAEEAAQVGLARRRGCASPDRGRATSGTNAPIASLMSPPRPARAWPKPTVDSATPVRVGGVNIDRTWSKSTSAPDWRSGTVAPSATSGVAAPSEIAGI